MPPTAPAKSISRSKKTGPVPSGLLKIWVSQRQLLRVLDAQRHTAPLHDSPFAVEVVTDGYYLLRKNLFDLVALNHDLPAAAQSLSASETESTGSRPPHDPSLHTMLAYDIAALNALAADYATLHGEMLLGGARDVAMVVQQHGRQLKNFLANLFPERAEN